MSVQIYLYRLTIPIRAIKFLRSALSYKTTRHLDMSGWETFSHFRGGSIALRPGSSIG